MNPGRGYRDRAWTHHPRPLAPLGVSHVGRLFALLSIFMPKVNRLSFSRVWGLNYRL